MLAFLIALLVTTSPSAATFSGSQPQLAAAGRSVYVAFALDDTISVARSDDGAETFGAPVKLPVRGKLSLGKHRGPRIAATRSSVLVSAVAGAKGGGADGDVLLFRSSDSGRSWAPAVVINDVGGTAREGLHAMAASPSGLVVIAWLDLRASGNRIYAATSRDHGATWGPDVLVYASPESGVCECCHPSIALDSDGRIAIMFRNNIGGNRDMYVTRSDRGDRFTEAAKVGTTSWKLNACPMDGGGLVFSGEGLAAAWRRDDTVYVSAGSVPERRVGTGRDPAIATRGGVPEIAWSSPGDVMFVRGTAAPIVVAPGRFPAILALPERTVLAWENQGSVVVRTIAR